MKKGDKITVILYGNVLAKDRVFIKFIDEDTISYGYDSITPLFAIHYKSVIEINGVPV